MRSYAQLTTRGRHSPSDGSLVVACCTEAAKEGAAAGSEGELWRRRTTAPAATSADARAQVEIERPRPLRRAPAAAAPSAAALRHKHGEVHRSVDLNPERKRKRERERDRESRRIALWSASLLSLFFDALTLPPLRFLPLFSLSPSLKTQPTSRRNAIGASLLFVGALLGFSTVFGSDNDEDAFFGPRGGEDGTRGESVVAAPPYRLVDGRAFVRTSGGDILSVGRLPRDLPDADRTLALMGDSGLFLLRLTTEAMRSVDLHSGAPLEAETEFLTRVFASGDWEGALFRVAPSRGEIERIMRENGMDVEKEEAEEEEADAEARARMK